MHEWLNVREQKAKMKQDGTCPCCGSEEEDQIHLYHCKHPEMVTSLEIGIDEMERNCHNANIPKSVYIAFINMIRLATQSTRQWKSYYCDEADRATAAQESLGTFAIL